MKSLSSPFQKVGITLLFFVVTIGLDQITKSIAKSTLKGFAPIHLLDGFLHFQYAENEGAFLSLGANLPESYRFLFFSVMTLILLLLIGGVALFKGKDFPLSPSVGLVVGGGIGNLIDRIAYGHVTDFMMIGKGYLRTGIFNVADVFITCGVLLIFRQSLAKNSQPSPKLRR